mgnify:CR=1 FL=1
MCCHPNREIHFNLNIYIFQLQYFDMSNHMAVKRQTLHFLFVVSSRFLFYHQPNITNQPNCNIVSNCLPYKHKLQNIIYSMKGLLFWALKGAQVFRILGSDVVRRYIIWRALYKQKRFIPSKGFPFLAR